MNESKGRDAAVEEPTPSGAPEAAVAPIDFNILVLSLNTSALIQLGEAEDAEGKLTVELPMARQTIDMLGILEEKTRGNLTGEEENLLHQVLFDLRMRYTRKARGKR